MWMGEWVSLAMAIIRIRRKGAGNIVTESTASNAHRPGGDDQSRHVAQLSPALGRSIGLKRPNEDQGLPCDRGQRHDLKQQILHPTS